MINLSCYSWYVNVCLSWQCSSVFVNLLLIYLKIHFFFLFQNFGMDFFGVCHWIRIFLAYYLDFVMQINVMLPHFIIYFDLHKNLFDSTQEFAEFVPDRAKTGSLLWDMCENSMHMHSHGVLWNQTFVNAIKF